MNAIYGSNHSKTTLFVVFLSLTLFLVLGCLEQESTSLLTDTFHHLRIVKDSRQTEVIDYLTGLSTLAKESESNSILSELWDTYYFDPKDYLKNSDDLDKLDMEFTQHYGDFYDILWVDTNTYVFYSIKQERDFRTVIDHDSNESILYGKLKQITEPTFVDFAYYSPSSEPAAFFVIPVFDGGQPRGWQVFQLSINKINGILSDRRNLGRTGEVYLLDSRGMMLSQSRFLKGSTILERKIDTETYRTALSVESGELSITDYRGVRVFSVFSRLELLGVNWIFVAEIDEKEILSARYLVDNDDIRSKILSETKAVPTDSPPNQKQIASSHRVDMNEYGFTCQGRPLVTHGVATCTAVTATYPGQFAYLAHLVPTDFIYSQRLSPFFGGDNRSNLLGGMIETMLHYDIYPFEKDSLEFVIIATHDDSFWQITEQLIASGFDISQITLAYDPEAAYANVYVASDSQGTFIEWIYESKTVTTDASHYQKLDDIYRRLVMKAPVPLRSEL